MKLARWVFLIAGGYGLLPVVYLVSSALSSGAAIIPDFAEMGLFFYASVMLYALWQALFILMATDPLRYRPMMIVAVLVEIASAVNPTWLYLYGFAYWIPVVIVNLALAVLMLVAFWWTRRNASLANGAGT